MYQWLRQNHPSVEAESVYDEANRNVVVMRLHKLDEEGRAMFRYNRAQERIEYYNERIGFRRLFQVLVEAKKPLIGHNMMFDLLFTYQAF